MNKYNKNKHLVKTGAPGKPITPSSLLTGLAAYWKMDEASGTRVDLVNGYNFAPVGSPTSQTGKIGGAVGTSGVTASSLITPSNADLQSGARDFTFAFWIWANDGATRAVLAKYGNIGLGNEYDIVQIGGKFRFQIYNSALGTLGGVTANNFGSNPLNTWLHVIAWIETGVEMGISVNGVVNTNIVLVPAVTNTESLRCGDGVLDPEWNGRFDEMGRWNRLLTPDEKTFLYNNGVGHTYPFN